MCDSSRICLDGKWDFQIDTNDNQDATLFREWRSVLVPMPWQAQFTDLRQTSGTAWYHRCFVVDAAHLQSAAEKSAILHFGAVDYHATVWVNGKSTGKHEGGYLPFEFDVIDMLREGENELLVQVIDATDDRQRFAEYPFSEIPHGKQSWYGPISGIWQSVWLEFRPKLHLTQINLVPSPGDATINIRVGMSTTPKGAYQIRCTVTAPDGRTVGTGVLQQALSGDVRLDGPPELWSPDAPNLYTVSATLSANGNPTYTIQKTCGFRTIEKRNGRLYLNGSPIYLRGALDQGYYPETIYSPPNLELLENQIHSAKALGLNCLRIHIKVEDPHYYEVADRLGMLVWTEIPNWALLTDASAERARVMFSGMVERDGHHPSIIAWTLVNENWGTDLTNNAEHRIWLADFYHDAKLIDPTRLIIDNSACGGNAHVASDLEDFHHYRVLPDHAREWDEWVAEFAKRSDWAWYPDFIHERRSDLPLIVSEFGNWGLPDPEEIREHGAEPWWFETGLEWGNGVVYPHGVEQRYEACGLANLFSSFAEFSRQAQEHMARSLHYEISSMRMQEAIAGYIITEFTDVHWECNGLLTMRRQPKHMLDPLLKDINQGQVIVLRPTKWSGRPGETIEVLAMAQDIAGQGEDGKIIWQAGAQSGELPVPGGKVLLALDKPGIVTLHATWQSAEGVQIATNQVNVACASTGPASAKLHLVGEPLLANVLRKLGYQVSEGEAAAAASDEIVVAGCYTRALEAHVQNGGRVLLLAGPCGQSSSKEALSLPVGQIALRANSDWQGDWANSVAWVKKQGPLAHLPGGPLLEMEWANIMPETVITDLPSWLQRSHSWAGLFVGWLHKPVSLLTVIPYGSGNILVTSFKLNPTTLAQDTIAQALFAGMLKLI